MILFYAFVLTLMISWIFMMKDKYSAKVPGPIPLPIIGSGYLFLTKTTEFLRTLQKLEKSYGDVVLVHVLNDRYLLLNHPKYIEPLIKNIELITKGKSYNYLRDWLGFGLLTSTGNRWRLHRKFLTPAFHFNILHTFLPVFIKNEKILIRKLKTSYCDGHFDVFPIIALTALDNITETIMGVSFNLQVNSESKYVQCIGVTSHIASLRMRNPLVANDILFNLLFYKRQQDKALKILHGHTKKVVEVRKEELKKANIKTLADMPQTGNKHAFIDLLLLSEIDGKRIKEEHVREEVDTFMFEGHDTTSSGITFALYCISKHEDVQEKILEEQKNILGEDLDRDPTYGDLKQMKYLELVIKESLRLFPSVPLIQRLVTKDVDLAGLHITKNTSIVVDIFHMQRHPELYKYPDEFHPERFDTTAVISANNAFSWLAFSAGPRNCIGQKFAMMEMKVTIAAIVKNFKRLPVDIELDLSADLILRSETGVNIKLIPRCN